MASTSINVIEWKDTIYIMHTGKITSVTNLSFKNYDVINVGFMMQCLITFLLSVFFCFFLFVNFFMFPRCLCNWPHGCYASTLITTINLTAQLIMTVFTVGRNTRPDGHTFYLSHSQVTVH